MAQSNKTITTTTTSLTPHPSTELNVPKDPGGGLLLLLLLLLLVKVSHIATRNPKHFLPAHHATTVP